MCRVPDGAASLPLQLLAEIVVGQVGNLSYAVIKPIGLRMFIVLAILITAAALLAVAYPILSKGSAAKPATTAQESLDELLGSATLPCRPYAS